MLAYIKIGEHRIHVSGESPKLMSMFQKNFLSIPADPLEPPDLTIRIDEGYGTSFIDYNVDIVKAEGRLSFKRADYRIDVDSEYKAAHIQAYDELALKHALINLYSSYIVYNNWGLLIHSSCVLEDGNAHMFAGESGAGKSTAAELSYPRELLSDEATIVRITPDAVRVFDSPFRSELEMKGGHESSPLASVNILYQAPHTRRELLRKSNGFLLLMDKVFYWAHDAQETARIVGLLKHLANRVPIYELHFQKNNAFWELIS